MIAASKKRFGRLILFSVILMSTALASPVPVSQAASANGYTDYDWQAIYLIKLSTDITWPQTVLTGDLRNINVCVMGNNPNFVKSLENFTPNAEQKKLKIIIKANAGHDDLKNCNVAYIPRAKSDYREIIAAAHKLPIVTIAPIDGFASNKGIIELVITEVPNTENSMSQKVNVKFKINITEANENGLKIETQTLNSASEVIQ